MKKVRKKPKKHKATQLIVPGRNVYQHIVMHIHSIYSIFITFNK